LILPAEIYHSAEKKLTFFVMRSSVLHGKTRKFGEELVNFYKQGKFSNVVILSATMSPVKRERESNRQ
jgi:predicted ATP-grasp superfamily ATP-dependent carboligase